VAAVAILTKKKSKIASLTDPHHHILPILRNKSANIKLESASLSCKSHRSKTATSKFLSENSKHRS